MKRVFKSTLSCMLAFAMVLGGFCNTGSSVSDAKTKKVAPVSLKKKSAIIVIKQNADKITKGNASIKIKKKKGVKIKTTTYKVADKSIVKVSKKGKVTAKRGGSTKVTIGVKYLYGNKTKTTKLTYNVKVKNDYKNILSGLTLKYRTYATFVGGGEGINPLYQTKVSMSDDFYAWKCMKLTLKDPSIAEVGKCGLIIGKKTGTTTATITSTDGTGLSVTATVKIFATEKDLDKKDDLYKNVRAEYMQGIMAGWDEEERNEYIDEDGVVRWSFIAQGQFQYRKDIDALKDEYRRIEKQTDNTPQDAVASMLSTSDEMLNNESADEKFLKTIHDKVIADIVAAKSVDELLAVSEDLVKRGMCGFLDLRGFYMDNPNSGEVDEYMESPTGDTIPLEIIYDANISFPKSLIYGKLDDKKDVERVKKHMKDVLSLLGMDDILNTGLDDYISLIKDVSDVNWTCYTNTDSDIPYYDHYQAHEIYWNLRRFKAKDHLIKKGYRIRYNDNISTDAIKCYDALADYMKEEHLDALKLFLAYVATKDLMEYSRAYQKVMKKNYPNLVGDREVDDLLKEKYKDILDNNIPYDIDQLYTKKYYTDSDKKQIEKTADEYIEAYRDAISASEYTAVTKKNFLDKLDKMEIECLYPDDEIYESLQIDHDLSTSKEGANLADNLLKVNLYIRDLECRIVGKNPRDIKWWTPHNSVFEYLPNEFNAYYAVFLNRCVIVHGGIGRDITYKFGNADDRETDLRNIAFMAVHIGHEIGHAFDTDGTLYNGDANIQYMWGTGDKEIYDAKADKLIDIYDSLLMYADIPGKMAYYKVHGCTIGESMADLGGAEIGLRIVKKKYPGDDECIRKYFAYISQRFLMDASDDTDPIDLVKYCLGEEHPYMRQRVNGVVSMMDEFYRVFDVKETDALYVAPEDRVKLW